MVCDRLKINFDYTISIAFEKKKATPLNQRQKTRLFGELKIILNHPIYTSTIPLATAYFSTPHLDDKAIRRRD